MDADTTMIPMSVRVIAAIDAVCGGFTVVDLVLYHQSSDETLLALDRLIQCLSVLMSILLFAVPAAVSAFSLRYARHAPMLQRGIAWLLLTRSLAETAASFVIVNESLHGTVLFISGAFTLLAACLCFWSSRVLGRAAHSTSTDTAD